MLSVSDFKKVIELTPLIAIDFIIEYDNKYLLGKRINEPAKNYWFVPGGRIYKNENLFDACKRISSSELGFKINFFDMKPHINTEHFYENNVFDNNINTHYIVMSYKYSINMYEYNNLNILNQHNEIIWMSKDEILKNNQVHNYTKNYFN